MADSYSKWVMTNAFASNSQAALNTGNKIEWVALKTSDDTHALNDLPGFNDTTLATAKIKQTSSINSVVINGNTVTITGLFNSAGNTADYYIKTIFLVAKYNGAEFLAGATVANTSGSAFRMPAASTTEITEFTARPQISVTNSSTISTTVDPVAAATNERVNSLETSLNSKIEDINTDKQKLWNKFADYVTKATAETISGVKTFSQTIVGSITGNAGTATKLQTARRINGTNFDGTSDINVNAANDSNLVHKTGDETIGGNDIFTGTNTFNKQIIAPAGVKGNATSADILNIRQATFTDIDTVTADMITYAGYWIVNSVIVSGIPRYGYVIIEVLPALRNKTAGSIRLSSVEYPVNYIGIVKTGSNLSWVKLAADSTVVHNTGTETVAGDKTFLNKIQGSITNADVADVRTNSISDNQDISKITTSGYYAGRNVNNAQGIPSANFNGKYFDLTVWVTGSNGFMFIVDDSDHMYFRKRQNSVWLDYKTMPIDDTKLVHNSGAETIYDRKTFDAVTTFNNGIVNKPISMNGFKIDVSALVSGTYNVWNNDISGCPADFGVVEVFENVSNTMYRFTQTNLPDVHVWIQLKNSGGFTGWKQQM